MTESLTVWITTNCGKFLLLLFRCSVVSNSCEPMDCSMPSFPVLHYFPNSLFAQTHVHWVGDVIQPSYPLAHTPPPAFSLSQHKDLCHWVSSSHQVARPKYWSFSFSISPSNGYLVLISFKSDWFDILAVQGTLKNLLQHHISKVSVLWCSAFFMVQLSHPYVD